MIINTHKSFFLVFFFWLMIHGFQNAIHAQNAVYFDHITCSDGLSQSDINSIYQDKQGFMWFATHDGLNKYDGYDFSVYKPETNEAGSIGSNLIYDVKGDKNDNLWIATTGSGLSFFDRATNKFTNYRHDANNRKSLTSDYISCIFIDNLNRLWVGSNRGLDMAELNKKDSKPIEFRHFNFEQDQVITSWEGNSITDIFQDSKNQLWACGNRGLFKLSRDKKGDFYFNRVNESSGLPNAVIKSISEDKSGRLLVGSEVGLFYHTMHNSTSKLQQVNSDYITDIQVDNNNNIWCGTNTGLLYLDNSPHNDLPKLVNKFTYDLRNQNGITKNIVNSIFMDKTGIIWVGTNGGGINKFDPERKSFRHVKKTLDPSSLGYDKVRSIFEDSYGSLWVGTEGGGLNMLTKSKNKNSKYQGFVNFETISNAFAITEIQRGDRKTLFIGVEDDPGLVLLDITNPNKIRENKFVPQEEINHSVFTILEDRQKNVWIGTYGGGIYRWIPNEEQESGYEKDMIVENSSFNTSLSNNIIRYIYEDSEENIWVATGNGLSKLPSNEKRKKHPKFEVFKNVPGDQTTISHNYILDIYESTRGELWIGTFGGGLNKYKPEKGDKKGRFITYSEPDGLPNNVIKGILEDEEGFLWLSTNQGLSRFDPVKENFKNYDVNDGLQSNEFQELARLKKANGEMLFGGVNGFNVFSPKDILENTYEAETVITDFLISNKSIDVGDTLNDRVILEKPINETEEIQLNYWENSFSFEFAALHYAAPQKNQFAYKLDGFNEDWIYTSSDKRFATYTNLEPGMYTLKVKASNNDGVWDKTPSQIRVKVIPPFWKTRTAYFIYGLLGLGLLIGFWMYTIKVTNRKHQSVLNHMELEKHEELQQMKLEFFTNISHEFRTPLTLIKGPLEYLQNRGHELENKVIQEQYHLMHKNTDHLLRLVNQLLDFRKMNQGKMRLVVRPSDIVSYIKEVGEPFQFLAHKQQIDFEIQSANQELISWFDHDALEKIMNNLLSNAFKFTPAKGKVHIKIWEEAETKKEVLENPLKYNKSYIVIEVRDSGPGISKSKLSTIFERFYMERDKNNKVNPEGVGVGLSFTKNLVELHQGDIQAASDANKGTTFTVRLPIPKEAYEDIAGISCKDKNENDYLMRSSEAESLAIDINDELADQNISQYRSKQPILLVVDDNADIRAFIKQSLGDKYTIHEAENGKQGLELAVKLIPNIILTDVLMPVMDGIKFCKKLKTIKETSHIPVLMLTAKSSQESEAQGLKTGADDYIRKPFDMELLQLKLTNIIKDREELRKVFNRKVTLQPQEVTVTSADERFLQKAMEIVEKHMMNTDFNVEMLVKEMNHSRSNLYLKFKELTGLSSSEFIRNIRLKRAMQLLQQSDLSVKEIMYMTGFNTASYFSKCFKKQFGVVPSEYVREMESVDEAVEE